MNNSCFIVMPPADATGYSQGHFNRVYDYVIVPACRAAGYWPSRAELTTYDNPLNVLNDTVDSDVALCDVSAGNASALYVLAVRLAFDLPVVVVKDTKSVIMFDGHTLDLVEYDDSLRIDTVQKAVEVLGEALKKAVETKKPRHELLNRLSIGLPSFTPTPTFELAPEAAPEPARHEPKAEEPRLPVISPLPDYVGEPFTEAQLEKLKTGDVLFHLINGKGKLNFVKKSGKERLASIQFETGPKLLVLSATDYFRHVRE
jgi:hypothetical protein